MNSDKPRLRISLSSLLIAVAFIAFVLAAFSRGNYLLGTGAGIYYALAALMIAFLFTRAMWVTPKSKFQITTLVVFSVFVSVVFAFPTYFNPEVQSSVTRQAEDRFARKELQTIFAEDRAFSDLSISITHRRSVSVSIRGTVLKKSDLSRLQQLVFERCRLVKYSFVDWQIRVREDSALYFARNQGPFVQRNAVDDNNEAP